MTYRRNALWSERSNSLSSAIKSLVIYAVGTACNQWLKCNLDDSANWGLFIAEALLTSDIFLRLELNVFAGLVVHPNVFSKRFEEELTFKTLQSTPMSAARTEGDRQPLHGAVRNTFLAASP